MTDLTGMGVLVTGAASGIGRASAIAFAAAGARVFKSAGCGSCHTLKAADATGTIGPNLDQLKPSESIVQHQVEVGGGVMPAFKGKLTDEQISAVAKFVADNAGK